MILTSRERNDLEVLYRICGVQHIRYDCEDGKFFAKQMRGIKTFIRFYPEDFPSLEKQSYSVEELLREKN